MLSGIDITMLSGKTECCQEKQNVVRNKHNKCCQEQIYCCQDRHNQSTIIGPRSQPSVDNDTLRTLLLVAVGLERLGLFFPCLALVGQLGELQRQIVHPLLLLLLLGVVGVLVLQQRRQFVLDVLVLARQLLVLGVGLLQPENKWRQQWNTSQSVSMSFRPK